jgi:hypothetical protein
MVLSFRKIFVEKILNGSKIHTIRLDPHDRWKSGKKIHFATGVRTPEYKQFWEGKCISVQRIEIKYYPRLPFPEIYIDDKEIDYYSTGILLFQNDGFSTQRTFLEWFNQDFKGKIIHWTKLRY